jgi:3-oxoacyl-[acyl-carrier protein] reductase
MNSKVALITGGSKGIGLGIAQALLSIGLKVVITGRDAQALEAALGAIPQSQAPDVLALQADVTDYDDCLRVVEAAHNAFGKIDTVIANAGIGHFANIEELTHSQWHETIDTNLTGPFYTLKATLTDLKETQGYYITIASLAGTNFFESASAYNASKFGLVGFTQAVMLDLRKHGIKVSTIMPGSVATHFANHTPSEADSWKIQPEDIGQMVVDLLRMNPRTLPSKIEVRPAQVRK